MTRRIANYCAILHSTSAERRDWHRESDELFLDRSVNAAQSRRVVYARRSYGSSESARARDRVFRIFRIVASYKTAERKFRNAVSKDIFGLLRRTCIARARARRFTLRLKTTAPMTRKKKSRQSPVALSNIDFLRARSLARLYVRRR